MLERDWTPHLRAQIQSLDRFCTTVSQWRRDPVAPATLEIYHQGIERVLGYRRDQGIALEALDLTDLLDLSVLQAYEQSGRDRGLASNSIKTELRAAVPIAQWQFHQLFPNQDYRNPEPVKTVRTYTKTIVDRGDRPRVSAEAYAERELTMDQCWDILHYLGWRCKDLEKQHGITNQVIDAWMDYLIIALLVTTGGRQREIRELTVKRLSVEENGVFIVTLPPEGHKTGRKTGKGREFPLFVGPMRASLSEDLHHYLDEIRPKSLGHDFLFFSRKNRSTENRQWRRGDPIDDARYLSTHVSRLIARVTAHLYGIENIRWTTPHDFRRILATWVCTYGEPRHLPIFAELLGHSTEMLAGPYNRMHPGQLARQSLIAYDEVAARQEQIRGLNAPGAVRHPVSIAHMSQAALVELLKKLVRKLWHALTQRKQRELFEVLTPAEREVIES